MSQRVSIEVHGAALAAAELDATAARGGDMTGIWPFITEQFIAIEEEQYRTQGARSGNRWPELSESWLWYKFQNLLNMEVGKATEETFDELTTDPVLEEGPLTLVLGADTEAFRIQQSGANPIRYPVDLTELDVYHFTQTIELWVTRGVNSRGQRITTTGRFAPGGSVFT